MTPWFLVEVLVVFEKDLRVVCKDLNKDFEFFLFSIFFFKYLYYIIYII